MDGGSVPVREHQKDGLKCRLSISQLQKSSAAGQLSTAEKNRATVSPDQGWLSALFCCSERYEAPGPFVQKHSSCKKFCSSKWEAGGHFAKAHGVPSKRKICLGLCLGSGFIGVLWAAEYYRLLWKTCGAELSTGSRFWHGQGAS